ETSEVAGFAVEREHRYEAVERGHLLELGPLAQRVHLADSLADPAAHHGEVLAAAPLAARRETVQRGTQRVPSAQEHAELLRDHGQFEEQVPLPARRRGCKLLLDDEEREQGCARDEEQPDGRRDPRRDRDDEAGRGRERAPARLAEPEAGRVERRVHAAQPCRDVLFDTEHAGEAGTELARQRRHDFAERLDGQRAGAPARRGRRRGVRPQPLDERPPVEPRKSGQHEGGADPHRDRRSDGEPHSENTRCSAGSFMSCAAQTQQSATIPIPTSTSSWPAGVRYASRPLPTETPASAMPAGTSSTHRRANRTPACLARASFPPCASRMRSSTSAARRRSTSLPPRSCAMSNVSSVASAVGSASRALRTATVRSKSVDSSHSRWPASKASRSSRGPRRPTSNSAWGIDRPSALAWMRISSIRRGQLSWAAASRAARRARDDASGVDAANRPTASAGRAPANKTYAHAAPATNNAAITPANSDQRTSARPACTSQSCRRAARTGGRVRAPRRPVPSRFITSSWWSRCTPVAAAIAASTAIMSRAPARWRARGGRARRSRPRATTARIGQERCPSTRANRPRSPAGTPR